MTKPTFPLQLAISTVVIGAVIGGLVLLGRQNTAPRKGGDVLRKDPFPPTPPAVEGSRASGSELARALLPADAWLVADFDGKLMGPAPFEGQLEGPCSALPAPERVGVALLPGSGGGQLGGLELALVVPRVSEAFWGCARQKVLSVGGQEVGEARGFEVLESPSGILTRTPAHHLIFVTSKSLLTRELAIARHAEPSAATNSQHVDQAEAIAGRVAKVQPVGGRLPPSLLLTVDLPEDWLQAAGPEADSSPLRHLTGAALLAREDGSAKAALSCREPGCSELSDFLYRAQQDLSEQLPKSSRAALKTSLTAKLLMTAPGEGRLVLSWASPEIGLVDLAREIYESMASGALPLDAP